MPVSPFFKSVFVVSALALLVVACRETQCPSPPPVAPKDASVPAVPCLTDASTVVDAALDASDAAPVDAAPTSSPSVEPPAAFAAFTREKATLRYRMVDLVDTHSVHGGRDKTSSTATSVVTELTSEAGVYRARLEWTFSSSEAVPAVLPDLWVVTSGELRVGEDPGPFVFRAQELSGKDARPVCREERDPGPGPYGKTLRRLCFDARGLVSLREENLAGPRVFELVRE